MPIRSLSVETIGLAHQRSASPQRLHRGHLVGVLLLASAFAVPMPGGVAAQTIDGVLLEQGTDRPIELGLVTLLTVEGDSVSSVLTNGEGRFELSASGGGEYLLAASALGYEPTVAHSVFTLPDGAGMSLQFRIKPLAVRLEGFVVQGRMVPIAQPKLVQNGFADRAREGAGRFLTPHDVEMSQAGSTADLLATTGRVTTQYRFGGDQILMLGPHGYCTPRVYLDGFPMSLANTPLEAIAPLEVIEAAEVYRSASEAPLRYGGGMEGCGVIVLWSKTR